MKIKDSIRIEIEMDQSMSAVSKKSSSEYYELKLQLRYQYFDKILDLKEKTFERAVKNIKGINKVDEQEKGFDFYIQSHSEMNKIPPLFIKDYLVVDKRSKKLVGRDNLVSKDKYRYTQSITLVNLNKGDLINIKGQKYSIKAINKNDLVLLEDKTNKKKVVTYSIVRDYLELLKE